ncbi:Uncharacterised protein (plasmid) [Tsukamurella tyrosinosolvens]|uniref:Uncharacterized protein n=1 Tax=Tsukamurella tyrosinosolvens TaxID=57704 RepID=A0A1H4U9L0_TSUTY|nr:hypothetical protein [Tsukamurella tyrosinosolvens]KXO92989.1 hypothetical protein AXK58_14055 [Tsukamurella tyrosinosolvens]SEC65436.1 hypothetical protein SAMN04489793_2825 [Tsukamurella tyrosinosolvens]VEH94075.1 Uncharacterised protein [Tsukamurella tyrosinosolvens]
MTREYLAGDRISDLEQVFHGTVRAVLPGDPDLYEVDWDDLGEPGSTSVEHADNLLPAGS